jgi:hypothetical protein
VTENLISRVPPCFGRHVKPLVLTAAVNIALGPCGLWPVLLIIHKEGLYLSGADDNDDDLTKAESMFKV